MCVVASVVVQCSAVALSSLLINEPVTRAAAGAGADTGSVFTVSVFTFP